ncbi:DnaT-like ssDNA-binding domain-containing protein [Serratia marcescens]|uniref:DnaT-like ssDNA-binding domain-containing protein n=1 Tax=Serratia marcescens TaxID=615 RepID=UPI00404670DE
MAGDWIKMRPSLLTNPKVNGIARILETSPEVGRALGVNFNGSMKAIVTRNVMRNVTVSLLLTVWGAANEHTRDGVFVNADLSDIDDIVGVPGFGNAMVSVGWAVFNAVEGSVTLPNFNEYNACGEVRRSNNAERQQRYRDKIKAEKEAELRNVTRNVTNNDREEKNREEKKDIKDPPLPPKGNGEGQFDFNSIELPEWLSPEIWRQWGEFCIELGKPVKTKRAAMANIKRLEEFRQQGHSPDSVILHCIANDWKTLSPPLVSHPVSNFIDFDGAFNRLITSRKKPQNRAEEIAKEKYSKAGLRMAKEFECRNAWRGYLSLAYKETGEQPYVGG